MRPFLFIAGIPWHVLLVLIAFVALAGSPARAEDITVFAAASLKNAIDQVVKTWPGREEAPVVLSFAGTAALARQIEAGAPADIFLAANVDWMDRLERQGLIVPDSRIDIAGNRLVLVAAAAAASGRDDIGAVEIDRAFDLARRLGPDGRLAMALVQAVPAGIYGRAALENLGLWSSVVERVVETDNVRAALTMVAIEEAPIGVVYATDARVEPRVGVIGRFPASSHPPIRYPGAVTATSTNPAAAAFLAHLASDEARWVFEAHGFLLPDGGR